MLNRVRGKGGSDKMFPKSICLGGGVRVVVLERQGMALPMESKKIWHSGCFGA